MVVFEWMSTVLHLSYHLTLPYLFTKNYHMQKWSTIGKANRSNLPYVHKKGTKSFVAVQHELVSHYYLSLSCVTIVVKAEYINL